MNVSPAAKPKRAVVIGASMAGLFAARALADYFDEVCLIERDALRDTDDQRRGIPQDRHTHVMLASGCRVLESFFPGISSDLAEAGAIAGDVAQDVRWFVEGGRLCRFMSGLQGFGLSRPALERVVRRRVRELTNVRFYANTGVDGLAVTADNRRVIGVKAGPQTVAADLVVDTTGRGSRASRWLEEIGYDRPKEEKVEIELRYTTRLFRRRETDLDGDNAAVILPTPQGKRGGVLIKQENERWIVSLTTHFSDFAPSELAGFIDFTRSLPDPCIYEAIRDAEPMGEPRTLRMPASVRRRYERVKRFPAGFLVLGDAISSFNPVYGQGMSVAALEAAELRVLLRQGQRNLSHRFFARAASIVDAAWSIAAANDLRMPEVTGRRNAATSFMNSYVPRLLRAGHHDPTPARAFLAVSNLLAPPTSLLHPSLFGRTLRAHKIALPGGSPVARLTR